MKLSPVTKLYKKNTATSKKFIITSCRHIVTSLSFFQFMANLQPSGMRILDVWSAKLIFSLEITFYLTKTENRTKKFLTQLSLLLIWLKVLFLLKNAEFLLKNRDISKIKKVLVLKSIFSKTTYVCVLTYQISSF